MAAIPAPPAQEVELDPLRMQEEAPSAPNVLEHQTHDGANPSGHHTQDEWEEVIFGDVMHSQHGIGVTHLNVAGLTREKLH